MPSKTIRELAIAFVAKTDKFDKGVDKVSKRTMQVEKRFASMKKSVAAAGAVLTGVFSSAVAVAVKRQIDFANRVGDVSNSLGIATEELSRWMFIAERSGLATEDLERIVKDLSDRSAKAAQGMGESRKALDDLGISAQAFVSLTFEEKILDLSKAFEGVDDSAEKVRLSMALFGESGSKFLNIINSGNKGVQELIKTSRQYANVIDQDTAAAATKFNETLGEIQHSVDAMILSIGKKFLPELQGLAGWFRDDLPIAVEKTISIFAGAVKIIDDLIQKFIEVRSFFSGGKEVSDRQFNKFFGITEESAGDAKESVDTVKTAISDFVSQSAEELDAYTQRWMDLGLTLEDVNVLTAQTAQRFKALSAETTGNRFTFEAPASKSGQRFALDGGSTPEAQREFRELDEDLQEILGRMDDLDAKGEEVASNLTNQVSSSMADIILDFENAGDAAENLLNSITNMLINIAVREPLENIFAQAVGSLSGAAFSGGADAGTASAFSGGAGAPTVAARGISGNPNITVVQNISTPDVESFNASRNQQMNQLNRGLQRATKNVLL